MGFKMKYPVKNDYLPSGSKRRSGIKLKRVGFVVDHDTGNPNSTAQGNVNYYKNSAYQQSASANVFIDDKEILICVPIWEKAWHVIYNKPIDNQMFGDDANDIAIGVELCYFPNDKARSMKAYEKYVWYNAWLAYEFKLNISKHFVGHSTLDPGRKTDPENAFRYIGKTFSQFLKDVQAEYDECTSTIPVDKGYLTYDDRGKAVEDMQGYLKKLGYSVQTSGYFNAETKKAVMDFQEDRGLTVDGIYGEGSKAEVNVALKELDKPKVVTVSKPVEEVEKTKDGIRMFKPSKDVLNRELISLLEKAKADGIISSDEWKEAAQKGELPLDDVVGLLASYLNRTHKK